MHTYVRSEDGCVHMQNSAAAIAMGFHWKAASSLPRPRNPEWWVGLEKRTGELLYLPKLKPLGLQLEPFPYLKREEWSGFRNVDVGAKLELWFNHAQGRCGAKSVAAALA